jgi:hypothetical protein
MKNVILAFATLCCFAPSLSWAQSNPSKHTEICGSSFDPEKLKKYSPEQYKKFLQREQRTQDFLIANKYIGGSKAPLAGGTTAQRVTDPQVTVTIPVVVHVVWNTAEQNITLAQIQSQIAVLNEDFRRRNADASQTPAAFQGIAADANIEFQLACVAPDGSATDGIVRAFTNQQGYSFVPLTPLDADEVAIGVKFVPGANAWPADRYLNIWTCNFVDGTGGYAQFPGRGAPNTDGVVVAFNAFGRTGTLLPNYNRGRITSHEIGHWLDLRHIWGDANCGDDFCSDTPTQAGPNRGCPTFPQVTCSNQGDMSMNYMDYTNDACKNLFTNVQKGRMRALFATGGLRESFISAKIQQQPLAVCGSSATFSVAANQGAAVAYNWTVTGALQLSAGQNTNQISVTATGTGLATVTVSANGYCDSWTTFVGIPNIPTFSYSESLSPCYGQDRSGNFAVTNPQPGANYTWDIVDTATGDIVYNGVNYIFYFNSAVLYPGTFRVTMRATSGCGSVNRTATLRIRDCGGGGMFRTATIYPNPATDVVTVELPAGTRPPAWAGVFDAVLYDRFGQQLRTSRSQRDKAELDVRTVPNGLYYLRIGTGNDAAYKQVQVAH